MLDSLRIATFLVRGGVRIARRRWGAGRGGARSSRLSGPTGDDQGALEAIEAALEDVASSDALRYLEGRLLLAVGRSCDAMEKLARTPATLPESMRHDSMRRWASAAAQCGHCAEARPVLLGIASSEIAVTRRDRAIAADCAIQLGELEIAAEELRQPHAPKRRCANRVALLAFCRMSTSSSSRHDDARTPPLERGSAAVGAEGSRSPPASCRSVHAPSLRIGFSRRGS